MRTSIWLGLVLVVLVPAPSMANVITKDEVARINSKLGGRVVDYTHNHGYDRRFFAASLN